MAGSSSGVYDPKFPKVHLDTKINYPNAANNIKKITAEEWEDLLHHTHQIDYIVDADGNFINPDSISIGGSGGKVEVTKEEFDTLKTTVESQAQTIQDQSSTITTLQDTISTLQTRILALEQNSGSSGDNTNGFIIGDWDAEREGIQDINGNTIG